MKILDNEKIKVIQSENFNHYFRKSDGLSMTWGKIPEEDPEMCPYGPLIADIEISTICKGITNSSGRQVPCSFCYKANTAKGKNMSLSTFREIFAKFPKSLGQVAFGIGSIEANEDLFSIMEYCRYNPLGRVVIPNITINGEDLSDYHVSMLAKLCGSIAISHYNDEKCFSAVKRLSDAGMKQVNIHQIINDDKLDECFSLVNKYINKEIPGLNAIVFLTMKPKGRGINCSKLTNKEKYKELIDLALSNNVPIGFDSCGCTNFLSVIKDRSNYQQLQQVSEPCESFGLFSCYIDVNGDYFPCSFCSGQPGWERGISVLECNDFVKDIWLSEKVSYWRNLAIQNNRCEKAKSCLIFNLDLE